MEPLKFEKRIKDRFGRRKLQPSDNAWGKLEDLLDNGEQDKKRNIWAYGVAVAAVAGILVLTVSNFGTGESLVSPTVISDTETSPLKIEGDSEYFEPSELNRQLPKTPEKNSLVGISDKETKQQLERPLAQSQLLEFENEEAGIGIEAIAQPVVLSNKENSSEAEADSLLHVAQQELAAGSNKVTTNRINPNELLIEAENELDHSFREQVLDKLKDGYKKVKGTLADRNN